MFQDCCTRRGCSPYSPCSPCSPYSCKCSPCNPCIPCFSSCRYCCPRPCFEPCLRKIMPRDLTPTPPSLSLRPAKLKRKEYVTYTTVKPVAAVAPPSASAAASAVVSPPASPPASPVASTQAPKVQTASNCNCSLPSLIEDMCKSFEQLSEQSTKANGDCDPKCQCCRSMRKPTLGSNVTITGRNNVGGRASGSYRNSFVNSANNGGAASPIKKQGGYLSAGNSRHSQKSLEQSCAEYLNVVHDNMLETTKEIVTNGMRDFCKCTMEKIQCISTQLVRTECLLSKMYLDLLDRFAQQNDKNLRQFQYLTQMVNAKFSSAQMPMANERNSQCSCNTRIVGGVCNKHTSNCMVNDNGNMTSMKNYNCEPQFRQQESQCNYRDMILRNTNKKMPVEQQGGIDYTSTNGKPKPQTILSSNQPQGKEGCTCGNANNIQSRSNGANNYPRHEPATITNNRAYDNQNCEEQILRIVKRLQSDTNTGESVTDEMHESPSEVGTSEETKCLRRLRLDSGQLFLQNSLPEIRRSGYVRPVFSDTNLKPSQIYLSQA